MERRTACVLVARLIACIGGGRGVHLGSHRRALGRLGRTVENRDRGMVTAELAVGILSVGIVLAVMLFAIGVGVTHVRTQEAARAGARAAARGDSVGEVRSAALSAMPGSRVSVRRGDERVEVKVSTQVRLPLVGIGTVNVASTSIADREPQ